MNETVRIVKGPTILLSSGNYLDLLEPERSAFTIEDIARGLSNTCRFAGQCHEFYSVAEHSVHVSLFVDRQDAYAGLMHDATEAFIHDIAKPLKVLLKDYREIEQRLEKAIFERFNVENRTQSSIAEVDTRMLVTEQQQLMINRDDWEYCRGRKPFDIKLSCWTPAEAYQKFLSRFWDLTA